MLLLRKQPAGDVLVLELQSAPDVWAEGEAIAAAINAACIGLSTRRSSWEDCILDPQTGPKPIGTGEVRYALPPGRDDVSPDLIEIYGGPGSGALEDWVVQLAVALSVPWDDGRAIVRRLQALAYRLAILPRHRPDA